MKSRVVYCGSIPAINGETGKQEGWLWGFHWLEGDVPLEPYECPECGALVGNPKDLTEWA